MEPFLPDSPRRQHRAAPLGNSSRNVLRLHRKEQRFMDDQRTPNLEEMDEQQAHRFLSALMAKQSAQEDSY